MKRLFLMALYAAIAMLWLTPTALAQGPHHKNPTHHSKPVHHAKPAKPTPPPVETKERFPDHPKADHYKGWHWEDRNCSCKRRHDRDDDRDDDDYDHDEEDED